MTRFGVSGITMEYPWDARLCGAAIDSPKAGDQVDAYTVLIEGWVVGREGPVKHVEFFSEDERLGVFELDRNRPDVARAYPDVPWAGRSGYRFLLNTLHIGASGYVAFRAILDDGTEISLGYMTTTREPLRPRTPPAISPLMVSTFGRTGSTWFTAVMGSHPQLIACEPFQYEPRVACYWMGMLSALSNPSSYLQELFASPDDRYWWTGWRAPFLELPPRDDAIRQFLQRDSIEDLASFCVEMIDHFYVRLAESQQREVRYFVERTYGTGPFEPRLIQQLYPDSREIFLVRDFRDVVTSMIALNARRGEASFGRENVETDEDFIVYLGTEIGGLVRRWQYQREVAHVVRYEDLVRRPNETLSGIFEHLEVDASPELVAEVHERARRRDPEFQREHGTSRDPAASIGRWQRDLEPSIAGLCNEVFAPALEAFGYLD